MIYNFSHIYNPVVIETKKMILNKLLIDKLFELKNNLLKLKGIISVDINPIEKSKKIKFDTKYTLERYYLMEINFENDKKEAYKYNVKIVLPKIEKLTTQFLLNGVWRQPIFQLLDVFTVNKNRIFCISPVFTIKFNYESGYISIGENRAHIGNLISTSKNPERFFEICGYNAKRKEPPRKTNITVSDLYEYSKINKDDNRFDLMIQNFVSQKIKHYDLTKADDFWYNMCRSISVKKINLYSYIELAYKLKIIPVDDKSDTMAEMFINMFKNGFHLNYNSKDVTKKKLYLYEYILNPVYSDIISFYLMRNSIRSDKDKTVNVINYLSGKIPEMVPLSVHENSLIHTINEAYKITLSGPQGLEKKAIPTELRNIHDSFYGKIDPIYTPDREAAGVINFLTVETEMIKKED